MTISERIMILIENNKMKPSDVADKLSISRSNLTRWKQKEYIPSTEHIVALAELFGVSTDWILKGEEETRDYSNSNIEKIEPSLSIDEERLIDDYRDMTTDGKRLAQKQIKNLREEHKKSKGALSNSDKKIQNNEYIKSNEDVS